ncbi:hypothetical protein [Chitinophaga rhizophila]|uniref:Lipoprotein n=1 Tax=Chitinophaga rhizophila TaxID=2866212 RepID=A0ABS7GMT7_9BACT|nr:hypothetical protein [Chitinophaga rhizophila]MBW8688334.1 hypothetical protein [Chitinophaga rhizophila]
MKNIRMMKVVPFLLMTAFLLSCNKKRATDFRDVILQKEKDISDMLIRKTGLESRKLEWLIAEDFDKAAAVVDSQEQVFNTTIHEIEALDTGDLAAAGALKQAAVDYHIALKELYLYPRQEIARQQQLLKVSGPAADSIQHSLLQLYKGKQQLYQKVYDTNERYVYATQQFNETHRL